MLKGKLEMRLACFVTNLICTRKKKKKKQPRGSTAFSLNGSNRRVRAGNRACIMESRGEGVAQRHLSAMAILCQQLL